VELSKQFVTAPRGTPGHPQLFGMEDEPARMTEWPDVGRQMRPVHDKVGQPRAITPVDVEGVGKVHPFVGGYHHTEERQLRMLMSAREIQEQYAPAEGDRMYKGTDYASNLGGPQPPGRADPRAGEITDRRATTDFRMNERWGHPVTGERYFKRTMEPIRPPIETNNEMWQRKAQEAAETPEEGHARLGRVYAANGLATPTQLAKYATVPPRHKTSLIEHLQSGADPGVIPLGVRSNPLSSNRKPMVAGGQHRIAALGEIDPDRLVPVEHWRDTHDAKFETRKTKSGRTVSLPRKGYT
jgi:hypothetical protein